MARLTGIAVVAITLLACGRSEIAEPAAREHAAARFRFGLSSYLTPDEVRELMAPVGPVVLEDSPAPPRGSCPRFDQLSLSFPDRSDLDHLGELQAQFINGRLYSVWFYPREYSSYLSALSDAGVVPDADGEFSPSAHVRGWTYTAFDGRKYVAWEDSRVAEEVRAWIMACS
jgi:hypothetical protein